MQVLFLLIVMLAFCSLILVWLLGIRPVVGRKKSVGANPMQSMMADMTICGELARAGNPQARSLATISTILVGIIVGGILLMLFT